MIQQLHEWVVAGHVVFGFFALAALWVPLATRKGGRRHVGWGRAYAVAMAVVVASAAVACVLGFGWPLAVDGAARGELAPAEAAARIERRRMFAVFLGYLALVTFQQGWHGLGVLRHKFDPGKLRRLPTLALHVATILSSGVVAVMGLRLDSVLLLALSPVGVLAGGGALRYLYRGQASGNPWWYEHMAAMIGTGIAANTAFLVFGANRLLPFEFQQGFGIVVWLLPAAVGTVAIRLLGKRYRRRFGGTRPA